MKRPSRKVSRGRTAFRNRHGRRTAHASAAPSGHAAPGLPADVRRRNEHLTSETPRNADARSQRPNAALRHAELARAGRCCLCLPGRFAPRPPSPSVSARRRPFAGQARHPSYLRGIAARKVPACSDFCACRLDAFGRIPAKCLNRREASSEKFSRRGFLHSLGVINEMASNVFLTFMYLTFKW